MVRVLVAEDSVTARELLTEILRSDPTIEVVGEARNGVEAVEMTRSLKPCVVTMDIRMPQMDGFEATRRIMIDTPTPIVIVSASQDVQGVAASMHALRAGALLVLAKPPGPESADFEEQSRRFVRSVKAMSEVKVVRRWPEPSARPESLPPSLASRGSRLRLVAIAASTGGPAAIARILSEMPGDFAPPVMVVQHIAPGFTEGFAAWLNTAGLLKVKLAEDGEPLRSGTVYVARDDRHLGVTETCTAVVSSAPPIHGFRPSATFLFESIAKAFGRSAVAVVLTGMGQDGVTGLRAFRASGGRILAQNEATSVVFGMPGATVAAGLADATLPLESIAYRLRALAAEREWSPAPAGADQGRERR